MNYRISNDGNQNDINEIKSMLEAYNAAHGAAADKTPVGIYYEDENGKKLAGITGNIFGNWLFIDFLFVSESLRGQGIGKELIAKIEENAKEHGCRFSFVSTNGFQAPGFYPKLGYKNVFTVEEFPRDGKRFYFTKNLV